MASSRTGDTGASPADVPIVQRAFELAETGHFQRLREIANRLEEDGYMEVQAHLDHPLLRKQLRQVLRKRRTEVG